MSHTTQFVITLMVAILAVIAVVMDLTKVHTFGERLSLVLTAGLVFSAGMNVGNFLRIMQ